MIRRASGDVSRANAWRACLAAREVTNCRRHRGTCGRPCICMKGRLVEIKGAVALVTGGNGGLGQRICHALAKEGAHIAVMYARSRDQAEGVARELASRYQVNAAAFACDITDGAAVEALEIGRAHV